MKLTVLGSDGSWPGPGGINSGYLLQHEGSNVWFDAGAGTMGALQQHIDVQDLTAIFITHAHPDHFVDLYPLSIARHYGGLGAAGLRLYAPPGFFDRAVKLLSEGTREAWLESYDMNELKPGDQAEVGNLRMKAFEMVHTPVSLGYRVEANGTIFAYSGDAGPDDAVVELARDAAVFVSEATWQDGRELPFHMTARQAAEHAARAGVGTLVLSHIEPILDKQVSLAQAREAFGGEILLAEPGLQLEVGPK